VGEVVIKKILDHLHIPSEVPKIHPTRAPPQMEFLFKEVLKSKPEEASLDAD